MSSIEEKPRLLGWKGGSRKPPPRQAPDCYDQ